MKIQYIDKQGVEAILKLLKNKISSIVDAVVFRGTVNSVADLPSLSDADVKPGDMYTVLTESQTTADFVEGAGETIDPYIEVVVVNQGTVLNPEYKWYVLGNVFTTKDKISYGQSLPNMPYDGMLFFYMGPDVTTPGNELYSNSFYAYNESENTWDYLWTLGDKIWRGTQAEWDALSVAEKDKYEQAEIIGLDNNGVVYVVDRIEAGNMNPVTSNAVAGIQPISTSEQVGWYEVGNLSTAKTYTVSRAGLLKVHFLKLHAAYTIVLYVNGHLVDSVSNILGPAASVANPITTGVLIAFVKAGDTVTIRTDGDGENWYVQDVTIQPISWFTN